MILHAAQQSDLLLPAELELKLSMSVLLNGECTVLEKHAVSWIVYTMIDCLLDSIEILKKYPNLFRSSETILIV